MITLTPKYSWESNKEYAYRMIKESIMTLELEPGQAISEVELADALQLSRTPIREVLAKLREEHLVEVVPQVGTYISKISLQMNQEASFMRYVLEKEVFKLACESFPKSAFAELKKNFALQQELLGQQGKEKEFHRLDKQFHLIIFKGKNKEHIWEAITRISTHYNRVRLLSEMQHSFDKAIIEHGKIVEMIEQKDDAHIENIVREHIIAPTKLWANLYSDNSPYRHYFKYVEEKQAAAR